MTDLDIVDLSDAPDSLLHLHNSGPICWLGRTWPTAAHAFAAAHTTSAAVWERIADPDTAVETAHRMGTGAIRHDEWPTARFPIVQDIVAAAEFVNPAVAAALADTGDKLIVAGGSDDLWGRRKRRGHQVAVGRNELGRSWMRLRAASRNAPPNRWVRAAVTGHREHLLTEPGTRVWVRGELERLAGKLVAEHDTRIAISGMATGADLWWADVADQSGMVVWAYQPHPEQTRGWRPEQIREHRRILTLASRTVTVGRRPDVRFYHDRNALMLTDADVVIAVRDPRITTGGTVAALRHIGRRRPVITVDVAARTTTIAFADPLFA